MRQRLSSSTLETQIASAAKITVVGSSADPQDRQVRMARLVVDVHPSQAVVVLVHYRDRRRRRRHAGRAVPHRGRAPEAADPRVQHGSRRRRRLGSKRRNAAAPARRQRGWPPTGTGVPVASFTAGSIASTVSSTSLATHMTDAPAARPLGE